MASRFETTIDGNTVFGVGNPDLLELPIIAICGARVPTHDICPILKAIAQCCKDNNVAILSTVNRGTDMAALRIALDTEVPTISVTSCAPDLIWPSNACDILLESECIISNETWGSQPNKLALGRADNLTAKLADACIIIEATMNCESLRVAYAAKQTWAIVGSFLDRHMTGANHLVEENRAIPLTSLHKLQQLIKNLSATYANTTVSNKHTEGLIIDEPKNTPWSDEELKKAWATQSSETIRRMRTPRVKEPDASTAVSYK